VEERFRDFSLIKIYPRTGRTHQIRVHLASLKHPLAGDREYGGKCPLLLRDITGRPADEEILMERQALHAYRLTFHYEPTGKELTLEAPLAGDIARLIEALRKYQKIE
jgi:23S rRNA pseudouridine1911/1915/1917 synthase